MSKPVNTQQFIQRFSSGIQFGFSQRRHIQKLIKHEFQIKQVLTAVASPCSMDWKRKQALRYMPRTCNLQVKN